MKENGIGGSHTKNGKYFENSVYENLMKFLQDKDIKIEEINNEKNYLRLYNNQKDLGFLLKQNSLYKFLKSSNINWKERISTKIIPDLFFIDLFNKEIIISEIKFQKVQGSVDEKLQTAHFKNLQYKKLFSNTIFKNFDIKYGYILNDWFKDKKYNDVLQYLNKINCFYYIYNNSSNFLDWEKLIKF